MRQQLLAGAPDSELSKLKLKRDVSKYYFVNQGDSPRVDSISDKTDYKAVSAAFKVLGFSTETVDSIWRTVAAILHLVRIFIIKA